MKTADLNEVAVSVPKTTVMMILCGVMSAPSIGAVSAATTGDEAPRVSVKFNAEDLASDTGAHELYHRLVKAAEQVCPAQSSGSPFVSAPVLECRKQAVARAVYQINNPRLAGLYASKTNSG